MHIKNKALIMRQLNNNTNQLFKHKSAFIGRNNIVTTNRTDTLFSSCILTKYFRNIFIYNSF